MPTPRFNEKDFFAYALKNFDTMGRPLNVEEFRQEANRIMHIPRFLKKLKASEVDEKQLRLLINYFIIAFNHFGKASYSLLMTVADESVYPELIAILYYINRFPVPPNVVTLYGVDIDLSEYSAAIDFLEKIR